MSICNDCLHYDVCKYRDEMQKCEREQNRIGTTTATIITWSINCKCRMTKESYLHVKSMPTV